MRNTTNVKFRTFMTIFLFTNLLLQPICIYHYISMKSSASSIIQSLLYSIILTFSIAIIINERIFKHIFYHMLKGKLIPNQSNHLLIITYILLLFVTLAYWLSSFLIDTELNSSSIIFVLIILSNSINQTYLISNGYLICGMRVIPLDNINWFKVSKGRYSVTLTIKYQGNRSFSSRNSRKCIEELSTYLETHQIRQRYDVA